MVPEGKRLIVYVIEKDEIVHAWEVDWLCEYADLYLLRKVLGAIP